MDIQKYYRKDISQLESYGASRLVKLSYFKNSIDICEKNLNKNTNRRHKYLQFLFDRRFLSLMYGSKNETEDRILSIAEDFELLPKEPSNGNNDAVENFKSLMNSIFSQLNIQNEEVVEPKKKRNKFSINRARKSLAYLYLRVVFGKKIDSYLKRVKNNISKLHTINNSLFALEDTTMSGIKQQYPYLITMQDIVKARNNSTPSNPICLFKEPR